MNSKLWIHKALSTCLVVALIATSSMVALANSERIAGELTVSGKSINGETPFVKVNGETAQNGRSIFSSSTVATPTDANAIINLGKIGKIELAPNTTLALSFDQNGINGELLAGQITVLSSSKSVSVKMLDGSTVMLNAGEAAAATTGKARQDDDDDGDSGGAGLLLFALILGGAAVGLIIAATTDNNNIELGGSATIVSPNR